MNQKDLDHFRTVLEETASRVESDAAAVAEQTRSASGGQGQGELSNAPMHLGDAGSIEYLQDLNAVLLENEEHLSQEVAAALHRIRNGTYGTCEVCGGTIPRGRLEAVPQTRYCVACAEAVDSGVEGNLNRGRPQNPDETLSEGATATTRKSQRTVPPSRMRSDATDPDVEDEHAVGTAGGGTAVGGLAGSNLGRGDPDIAELQDATGSGSFDVADGSPQELRTTSSGKNKKPSPGQPRVKRVRKKF